MDVRYTIRPHDWAFLTATVAAILLVAATVRGHRVWASAAGLLVVVSVIAARRWSQKYPGPMPSAMRWFLFLTPHATQYLVKILRPRSGERILEIGPGVGHHALGIAPLLRPNGALGVVDVHQKMLNVVMHRAAATEIANILPTRADAQNLPYPDATFDAAYLSAVLGEILDQMATLRELRRVLKPHRRLVVAEVLIDPDYVSLLKLRERAEGVGFIFDDKLGLVLAYAARFRASGS
jgi:SAM-dependent methyltransferase